MRYLVLATLVLAGCVTQPAPIAHTVSGRPEAVFQKTPEETATLLAERCLDRGLIIQEQSPSHLVCGKVMQGNDAFIAGLAFGTRYGTDPEQRIRFAILRTPTGTRVQAYQWVETQNAYGQTSRHEINNQRAFNDTQQTLFALGGELP